jgi:hypothetical protein
MRGAQQAHREEKMLDQWRVASTNLNNGQNHSYKTVQHMSDTKDE